MKAKYFILGMIVGWLVAEEPHFMEYRYNVAVRRNDGTPVDSESFYDKLLRYVGW